MSIDTIRDALPDYARDLKLNLSSLLADTVLSEQQRLQQVVRRVHGAA